MEPPFLVLRDGHKILAHVPFATLCQMQRRARRLMWQAIVTGDRASKQQIEAIFSSLQPSDARAMIVTLVMQDACNEAEEGRREMQAAQAQQAQYAQQQAAQQKVPPKASPRTEAGQQQAQQVAGEPGAAAPRSENDYFCVHGCPTDVTCAECEALANGQARRKPEAA